MKPAFPDYARKQWKFKSNSKRLISSLGQQSARLAKENWGSL